MFTNHLRSETGIDSFKFDAGESNWLPSSLILDARFPASAWPAVFSTSYVTALARFGGMVEVRTGRRTQHLPVFTRSGYWPLIGWGFANNSLSLVTGCWTSSQHGVMTMDSRAWSQLSCSLD